MQNPLHSFRLLDSPEPSLSHKFTERGFRSLVAKLSFGTVVIPAALRLDEEQRLQTFEFLSE
jgi:hypothetical protein